MATYYEFRRGDGQANLWLGQDISPIHQRAPWNLVSKWLPSSYRRHYSQGGGQDYFPRFFGFDKGTAIVSYVIAINCSVFMYQWWPNPMAEDGGDPQKHAWFQQNVYNSAENVREGRWWVMLNCSFAHANLLHLGINMLTLWNCGRSWVRVFGAWSFAGLWVVSALACSGAHIKWQNTRKQLQMEMRRWDKDQKLTILGIPISRQRAQAIIGGRHASRLDDTGAMGASGAMCGLIGTFLCAAPSLQLSVIGIPVPLWLFELFFLGGSAYCLAEGFVPQLGHAGHIGGTLTGMAYYFAMLRRIRRY